MIGQLKDGFEIEINEACINDWTFVKAIRKVDRGDVTLILDVAEMLLGGEEQVEMLEQHIAVDGKVPLDAMQRAIMDLMESVSELKN